MSGLHPVPTRIAHDLRCLWVRDRPALYHGTPRCGDILRANALEAPAYGDRCVSFSRRPEVAVYFAMLERDEPHDGAVLILDRRLLAATYPIDVRHSAIWGGRQANGEAEEAIWSRVPDLRRYLIDVVAVDETLADQGGEV